MISVEPQTESAESQREPRCFAYYWLLDDMVEQAGVANHAAEVAEDYDLSKPIEIIDHHQAELFADRPIAKQLMNEIREGDHLVVAPTSVSIHGEWYICINRWTRMGLHVHVVDAVLCETYEMADEPNMFDAIENHLLEVLRGAPHGFPIH